MLFRSPLKRCGACIAESLPRACALPVRFVCMTGGSYLSEARAGQCPALRRQPPKLEAMFAVPDRFWAGQRLYDPPVWPVFLSGTPKGLYGPFYDPRGDALSYNVPRICMQSKCKIHGDCFPIYFVHLQI